MTFSSWEHITKKINEGYTNFDVYDLNGSQLLDSFEQDGATGADAMAALEDTISNITGKGVKIVLSKFTKAERGQGGKAIKGNITLYFNLQNAGGVQRNLNAPDGLNMQGGGNMAMMMQMMQLMNENATLKADGKIAELRMELALKKHKYDVEKPGEWDWLKNMTQDLYTHLKTERMMKGGFKPVEATKVISGNAQPGTASEKTTGGATTQITKDELSRAANGSIAAIRSIDTNWLEHLEIIAGFAVANPDAYAQFVDTLKSGMNGAAK